MSAQDFRAMVYRWAPKAVLDAGPSPHGLCALAHNQLLEVGCSTAEESAITGRSLQTVERYAQPRNQEKLARRAMARWVDSTEEDR